MIPPALWTRPRMQRSESICGLADTTKIIIAQRITSVMDSDQIIILEDGEIHAAGTHKSLLESDPIYQELYYSQQKGADEDGKTV